MGRVVAVEHVLGVGACRLRKGMMHAQGLQTPLGTRVVVKLQHTLLIGVDFYSATTTSLDEGSGSFGSMRYQGQGDNGADSHHHRRQQRYLHLFCGHAHFPLPRATRDPMKLCLCRHSDLVRDGREYGRGYFFVQSQNVV